MEIDIIIVKEMLVLMKPALDGTTKIFTPFTSPLNEIKNLEKVFDEYSHYLVDKKLVDGDYFQNGMRVKKILPNGLTII